MPKLSYTAKITLSITMKEFLKNAKPLVPRKELIEAINSELMQCGSLIGNGQYHLNNWRSIFYFSLQNSGIIKLTEEGEYSLNGE